MFKKNFLIKLQNIIPKIENLKKVITNQLLIDPYSNPHYGILQWMDAKLVKMDKMTHMYTHTQSASENW